MCGRAHGVTDDGLNTDDAAFDDDHCGGKWHSMVSGGKRMHSPRISAGRDDKDCGTYRKGGKESTSCKSLADGGMNNYDHDKDNFNTVGADDADGEDDAEDDEEDDDNVPLADGCSKGNPARRANLIHVEKREISENLATWLAELTSSLSSSSSSAQAILEQADTTANKDENTPSSTNPVPARPIFAAPHTAVPQLKSAPASPFRGLFQCRACRKVFPSHQALGGHRASHKKVKGCFAARLGSGRDDFPRPAGATVSNNIVDTESNGVDGNTINNDDRTTSAPETTIVHVDETSSSFTAPSSSFFNKEETKVHECSICRRVFMSGQALGGHKRRHWLTTTTGTTSDQLQTAAAKLQPPPFGPQDHVMHAIREQFTIGPTMYGTSDSCLDLNMPTMNEYADGLAATRQEAELSESMMMSLNAPAASLYMDSRAGPTANGHHDLQEATATEDEEDSTSAKRAKISDLKDMNMAGGETSQWLQVGIALPPETNERLLKPNG